MPGLDGTGPMGQGAMTGKGRGNHQGNCQQLCAGYGKGNSRGQRIGTGFRHGRNLTSKLNPLAKDGLTFLKNKANNMENNLNAIKSRISELEQNS